MCAWLNPDGVERYESRLMKRSEFKFSRVSPGKRGFLTLPRRARLIALVSIFLGLNVSVGAAEYPEEYPVNPYSPQDKQAIAHGGELFGRNCQQCHNSHGKGGKAPQLIRGAWGPGGANSDAFMFNTINAGRSGTQMGAWGLSLSPEDMWAIITYLRSEAVKAKIEDDQDDQ